MLTRTMQWITTATAGALLAVTVSAQDGRETDPTAGTTPTTIAPVAQASDMALASDIIGENVTALVDESKDIGDVKNLVTDANGKLLVVIDRDDGGFVGVPFERFEARVERKQDDDATATAPRTAKVTALTFKGDKAELANAPQLEDIELVDAAWMKRSCEYFSDPRALESPPVPDTERTDTTGEAGTAPTDPGSDGYGRTGDEPEANPGRSIAADAPAAAASTTKPVCVDELVGKDVTSNAGKHLADVKDVAVDLGKGEVAYVIISSGGVLGMGDALHGVALDALVDGADGKLALAVDEATLKRTPGLDMDRLPTRPNLDVPASVSMRTDGDSGLRR
jgi:hypothetical protein